MTDQQLPAGFLWTGVRAGIKASGNPDLAIAIAPSGAAAAAMFTTNQVVAAPIIVGRKHIEKSGGYVRALVVNAGNANCATGDLGLLACDQICQAAAAEYNCTESEVFPSSTGIIGVPLPYQNIVNALPLASSTLGSTPEHAAAFANTILTTDTKAKIARATIEVDGAHVHIFGVCKGAGMIGPQLGPPHATMLVYLFTDLQAEPDDLRPILNAAVEQSFNSISIDGDMSTNDTVLLLASGASKVPLNARTQQPFEDALQLVCNSLAQQIIDDGEGVTHVVTLHITGARSKEEARRIAKSIAHSPLCKTAWSSGDPNWGRILAAAGYAGVKFDPATVSIHIGPNPVFSRGTRAEDFNEEATHAHMLLREYTITFDLGHGKAETRFLTCDLTSEYVRINADYST